MSANRWINVWHNKELYKESIEIGIDSKSVTRMI